MPTAPPIACSKCSRAKPCECEKLPGKGKPRQFYAKDNVDKLYDCSRWRKFSMLIRDMNPICQHVIKGVQCRYPSKLVHHLISPRVDLARLTDPKNVVALCWNCHITTEGELKGAIYCPTKFIMGAVYEHVPKSQVIGTPEWFAANTPR